MQIYPAIDIKNGRAVRLVQGLADNVTDYGAPVNAGPPPGGDRLHSQYSRDWGKKSRCAVGSEPVFQLAKLPLEFVRRLLYNIPVMCRCDGIGRRSGLKIHRWRQRTGSSPVTGTMMPP